MKGRHMTIMWDLLLWEERVVRTLWSNDWSIQLLQHLSHAIEKVLFFVEGQREQTWSLPLMIFPRYSIV
jgi:hypothetical protein